MDPTALSAQLGIYGQAGALRGDQRELYSALGPKLSNFIAAFSRAPGIPAAWGPAVIARINNGDLVKLVPTTAGYPMPAWLIGDPALVKVWNEAAERMRKTVFEFSSKAGERGVAMMESDIAWAKVVDATYRAAVAIRDAPKNAVGAVLDGVGNVGFGLVGTLLKSPVVWIGAAVAVVMFIGPGKVAKAALSKVK